MKKNKTMKCLSETNFRSLFIYQNRARDLNLVQEGMSFTMTYRWSSGSGKDIEIQGST